MHWLPVYSIAPRAAIIHHGPPRLIPAMVTAMNTSKDKNVLATGGSSGQGRAIGGAFAAEEPDVIRYWLCK
jgi:hypothetical protein